MKQPKYVNFAKLLDEVYNTYVENYPDAYEYDEDEFIASADYTEDVNELIGQIIEIIERDA
jgi:hypothetical protein